MEEGTEVLEMPGHMSPSRVQSYLLQYNTEVSRHCSTRVPTYLGTKYLDNRYASRHLPRYLYLAGHLPRRLHSTPVSTWTRACNTQHFASAGSRSHSIPSFTVPTIKIKPAPCAKSSHMRLSEPDGHGDEVIGRLVGFSIHCTFMRCTAEGVPSVNNIPTVPPRHQPTRHRTLTYLLIMNILFA